MRLFSITLSISLMMWLSLHPFLHFEGWYGPAAAKSIFAVYSGNNNWDQYTRVISFLHTLTNLSPETIALTLSCFGYICACLGSLLLSKQWFQHSYTLLIFITVWHPLIMIGHLLGPDMLCIGIMMLGIAFACTFAPVSGLFVLFSVSIKPIAAPLLAFLPFCVSRKIIFSLAIFALFVFRYHLEKLFFLSFSIPSLLHKTPSSTQIIFVLSCLFALCQKKNRLRNILLLATVFISASIISVQMSQKLRPRYLIAPSLVLLILYIGLLTQYTKRYIRWSLLTMSILGLSCDSWSFLYHWTQKFTQKEGIASSIPKPPTSISAIHSSLLDLTHSDHSAQGAISLQKLGSQLSSGAAIIELRDTRHYHLLASLVKNKYPYRVLSPENCCKPLEALSSCAIRTVQEMNQSGGTLILPTTNEHRIKQGRQTWVDFLLREAQAYPNATRYDQWWFVMKAGYSQVQMPCKVPPKH